MDIHDVWRVVFRFSRKRRMKTFISSYRVSPHDLVLDVGGTEGNWVLVPLPPRLVLLNLRPIGDPSLETLQVVASGCHLPFSDNAFKVVFTNSTIEHVGDWGMQEQFAREIRRVGQRYFVQTPNRSFPIEPHFLAPLIHFLPMAMRIRVARNFTVWGWITRPSLEQCREQCESIRLLTASEMRTLFPDARLRKERLLGATKSLIAERTS